MILLTLSRGKGEETVRLQLPDSPAEIGEAFASLDRISLDTGATTAGGNLIWTATVPAFPLLWKLLQTRRIPPPATAP